MRTVVAMSGGVDSSVAALELKKAGREIIGITIKTWPKEECGASGEKLCCSLEAIQYARSVAEDLDIPYYVVDLSREFAREVKEYFAEEYARGRTPNPCVYCNSKIKFGYLFKKANELGAERIATGHYARIVKKGDEFSLAEAKDEKCDQSYFLYDIPKEALAFIDFPLGEMGKDRVREIATENGFTSADRRSSQDICFAPAGGDYRKYLEKTGVNAFFPGDILDTSGRVIGKHKGIAWYTVGQRRGIGVAMENPVYVLKIDTEANAIVVGEKTQAMNTRIRVGDINWLASRPEASREFETRIRYNSPKKTATIDPLGKGEAMVEFHEPEFAPTPGQAAVFYDGGIVAGGGWIEEVLE
ncbi:MAG: tRNA 2-thiouridine(34) synthase MnmA [Candidatus Omnitrophica bacterium]|nr:tRNA 2-thiouridine(34) synthase MnmA [Candidatus Omnitrophota bacterium]